MLFNIISWVCIILVISSVISIVCICIAYIWYKELGTTVEYGLQDLVICVITLPILWIVAVVLTILENMAIRYKTSRKKFDKKKKTS